MSSSKFWGTTRLLQRLAANVSFAKRVDPNVAVEPEYASRLFHLSANGLSAIRVATFELRSSFEEDPVFGDRSAPQVLPKSEVHPREVTSKQGVVGMTTAMQAYEKTREEVEKIKRDDTHDLRETMEIGDDWPQGDLKIIKIAKLPSAAKLAEKPEAQLAPGNTMGSRHCLSDLSAVNLYKLTDANVLEGPLFEVKKNCEVTVEHPEHGNVRLGPGLYAIEYQRAYADELRRVRD